LVPKEVNILWTRIKPNMHRNIIRNKRIRRKKEMAAEGVK